MKTIIKVFFVALAGQILFGCKENSNMSNEQVEQLPTQAMEKTLSKKGKFTGKYVTEYDPNSYLGEVTINHFTEDTLFFSIIIGSAEGCTGDVEGKAYFKSENVAFFSIPDCPHLAFEFKDNGELWVDEQSNCQLHGTACGFGNVYRMVNEEPEFSGIYKVGKTQCEVVPVKMAFEVNWKGKEEPEMYFFVEQLPNGNYLYSTEASDSLQYTFELDSTFTSGVFVDEKGQVFSVNRLK